MSRAALAIFLLLASSTASAACRSMQGNWVMQTTQLPGVLEPAGISFSSSLLYMTIANSQVTVRKGTSMVLFTDGAIALGVVNSGAGSVSVNPANCRLRLELTTQITSYTNDGQQTISVQTSGVMRGRGDYVKLTKGFAGSFARTASGVSVPGRFEVAPE